MNRLKKGPEIKLSDLKVPGFLLDVYYDLRDRHLLPLAAILVVAIAAVPILFGGSSGSEDPGANGAGEGATASASSSGQPAGELVARSAPGLRDYRRRLHGQAKDPFKQQYTNVEGTGSGGSTVSNEEGSSGSSSESSSTTESSTTIEPGSTETTPSSQPESTPGPGQLRYYSYAIDVRVVPGGPEEGDDSGEAKQAKVRRNLPELTMLPARKTPAVIYMGSTRDGKKALLLISSNVQSIFGDARCVLGSQTCELLAVEPGLPETFVYGGAGKTFKIELLKIHLVETKSLNRAPLGTKPQKHSESD